MATLVPYATIDEFRAFWKDLSAAENERATSLLTLASNRLRMRATSLGIDLDAARDDSEAYASVLQWVVMEAVKRAMLTPVDTPPVNSMQKTAGPYSENLVFTNPAGDLWFKKSELSDLGLSARQTLSSISTVPGSTMYDSYESS